MRATVAQLCRSYGLLLHKHRGQHFLVDPLVLETIVETAHINSSDTILEIGPGIGVLTKELLARACRVIAIEVDARFPACIEHYCGKRSTLEIILGNALHVDFPKERYKIVANIPYHITSPLLRHTFLESSLAPTSLTLLLQREVAENICDTANASMLTILVGLFGKPRLVTLVPPTSFFPPPKVDSAVLHIDCFPNPRASRLVIDAVFRLTHVGFSQKRKMLRNTFQSIPNGLQLLALAQIDPTRRPQTLSIEEWIRLAMLTTQPADPTSVTTIDTFVPQESIQHTAPEDT